MPAPASISTDVRLGDFIALALASVALAVTVAGLVREAPKLSSPTLPPVPAKPALVKLDPTKLRTAAPAAAEQLALAPDTALAPAPLAPVASLPDARLPSLPTVPVATVRRSSAPTTSAAPAANRITAGGATVLDVAEMAGRQPWPEYPLECLRRRESGVVRVQFEVGGNGAVRRAQAVSTSGCHRLDEAATETILRRWEFAPGEPRLFEISIHFQLQ